MVMNMKNTTCGMSCHVCR